MMLLHRASYMFSYKDLVILELLAMSHFVRRSLLVQLLSVYLLFVMVVLLGGVGVNAVIEQRLRNDVQASDQALAQEIAVETGLINRPSP